MTEITSEYFTIVDPAPVTPRPMPPTFAAGLAFHVEARGTKYRLSYLSGELHGREKTLDITEAEARALRDGTATLDAVLIAHDAS